MDLVIFDALDVDRLKRSQADVQGDIGGLDTALADPVEDFWCEMQASRGSRDRSTLLGVDGLIALAIVGGIRARNVRRERDVADAVEDWEEILNGLKANAALAEFSAGEDFGLQFILPAEKQAFADADLAAGPNQAFPIVWVGGKLAREQYLDASVEEIAVGRILRADGMSAGAFAATVEPRWKNARVVEDHDVAGL
jgi:hypothetical protein